ncbi:MAG: hypothetical protein WBX25_06450 [Rhodomicrobium sp.]
MKKILACAVTAVCLVSAHACAQQRVVDSGLGAVSGGVLFGPVGLIAGGVVGYTAGPSIARAWGLSGHRHYRRYARWRAH